MLKNKKLLFINLAVIVGLIFVVALGKQHLAESKKTFEQEESGEVVEKDKVRLVSKSNPLKSTFFLPFKDQTDFNELFLFELETMEVENEEDEEVLEDEIIEEEPGEDLNIHREEHTDETDENNSWQTDRPNQSTDKTHLGNPSPNKNSNTNSSEDKKKEQNQDNGSNKKEAKEEEKIEEETSPPSNDSSTEDKEEAKEEDKDDETHDSDNQEDESKNEEEKSN